VHGRVAMLACIGMIFPSFFHFSGNGILPDDTFAELNPFKAVSTVPLIGWLQITLVIFGIELARIKRVIRGDFEAGDLGLGQTGFNPFGFDYTEEEYRNKQVQEKKHGRLAMFGIIGLLLQAKTSGVGIVQQLSGTFVWPSSREILSGNGVLGDFFPTDM
jgi:hypothetical protein